MIRNSSEKSWSGEAAGAATVQGTSRPAGNATVPRQTNPDKDEITEHLYRLEGKFSIDKVSNINSCRQDTEL